MPTKTRFGSAERKVSKCNRKPARTENFRRLVESQAVEGDVLQPYVIDIF
ncbi:hypothetical protein RP20_CCG025285 [Aedes albopictus]|nr:hypothetical protein RP20_CCG025285 [Aedes albopictus]